MQEKHSPVSSFPNFIHVDALSAHSSGLNERRLRCSVLSARSCMLWSPLRSNDVGIVDIEQEPAIGGGKVRRLRMDLSKWSESSNTRWERSLNCTRRFKSRKYWAGSSSLESPPSAKDGLEPTEPNAKFAFVNMIAAAGRSPIQKVSGDWRVRAWLKQRPALWRKAVWLLLIRIHLCNSSILNEKALEYEVEDHFLSMKKCIIQ